jgi:2-dehydropantoate 2-reductase
MKVCVVGVGAIGGLIGTRLALSGQAQVSAWARGATLDALRAHGWRLRSDGRLLQCEARASDEPAELGPQDIVIIAVKGPALPAIARRIAPLLGPDTMVVPAMNGVPWWFHPGLRSVDPDGAVAAAIPPEHVIGCVVHASAMTSEPGLVEHQRGLGLIVGEPSGQVTPRVQRLGELLHAAGFDARVSPRIREDIWYKLWGNLTTNPVSAITGATADRIVGDPLVSAFCQAAMAEAAAIGDRIGCHLDETPAERHQLTRKLGAFKTSMLQDALAGRALELDAIVGAVRELGQLVAVPTPQIDTLFGLARLFARVHGLYPDAPAEVR